MEEHVVALLPVFLMTTVVLPALPVSDQIADGIAKSSQAQEMTA